MQHYIQSIIDCTTTIWDSASGNAVKSLAKNQRRAIKTTLLKSKINQTDYN